MNKTILLTGGTGKLGAVLTKRFLELGFKVVVTYKNKPNFNKLLKNNAELQKNLLGLQVDFTKEKECKNLVLHLAKEKIHITHLINNARSLNSLSVQKNGITSFDNFTKEFQMDVITPYELAVYLSKSKSHKLENIVNIGSMYGLVAPNPNLYEGSLRNSPIQYGVSKAALHHLTKELAMRLADKNIRVNCVAFGGVEGRVNSAFKKRYAKLVPSKRMLKEEEVIGPVEFLLSESSASVNGHVLVADGGWSIY